MNRVALICAEAVRLHGSNWQEVEAHIARKLAHMAADERALADAAVRRLMPDGPGRDVLS